MAITKSWAGSGIAPAEVFVKAPRIRSELFWLVCASLFVAAGLAIVYAAKVTAITYRITG